jgi:flavin-dependent dehydrogenase
MKTKLIATPNSKISLHDDSTILIAGAGPSGIYAAMTAKRLNPKWNVLLIDSRSKSNMLKGGPSSCKGCQGLLAGQFFDLLKQDFGITVPQKLIAGKVYGMTLINVNNNKEKAVDLPFSIVDNFNAQQATSFITVGSGIAGYKGAENISFDMFMRKQAEKQGVKLIEGKVSNVWIPNDKEKKINVEIFNGEKKQNLLGDLFVNATGVNSTGVNVFKNKKNSTAWEKLNKANVKQKMMAQYEFRVDPAVLDKFGKNRVFVYVGLDNRVNSYIVGFKYELQGDSWVTVSILPQKNIEPIPHQNASKEEIKEYRLEQRKFFDQLKNKFLKETNIGLEIRIELQKKTQKVVLTYKKETGFETLHDEQTINNDLRLTPQCTCLPCFPISVSKKPYNQRYVEIGDIAGTQKFGRHGITYGSLAGRTALISAFNHGVSEQAFRKHYYQEFVSPLRWDAIFFGKIITQANGIIQNSKYLRTPSMGLLKYSLNMQKYVLHSLFGIGPNESFGSNLAKLITDTRLGTSLLSEITKNLHDSSFEKYKHFFESNSNLTPTTIPILVNAISGFGFLIKVQNKNLSQNNKPPKTSHQEYSHVIKAGDNHTILLELPNQSIFRMQNGSKKEIQNITAMIETRFKLSLEIDTLQNKSFIQSEFNKIIKEMLERTTGFSEISNMYMTIFTKMFNSFYSVGKNGRLDLRSFHRGAIYSRDKGTGKLQRLAQNKLSSETHYSSPNDVVMDKQYALNIFDGKQQILSSNYEIVYEDIVTKQVLIYTTYRNHPEFIKQLEHDINIKKFRTREVLRSTFVKLDETDHQELFLMMIGPDIVNLSSYMQNIMEIIPQLQTINSMFRRYVKKIQYEK